MEKISKGYSVASKLLIASGFRLFIIFELLLRHLCYYIK